MIGGREHMKAREAFEAGARHQLEHDCIEMGPCTSYSLAQDPKHMAFVLSRYKFVAKMLKGMNKVIELGSGDGFGLPIVAQEVGFVHCVDWDSTYVDSINKRLIEPGWVKNASAILHDINVEPLPYRMVDAVYMIDVLEHIDPDREDVILTRLCNTLNPDGVMLLGIPNKSSSYLASKVSDVQHINLKTAGELKKTMCKYFNNIFLFGMNDEVLHTGYYDMCHYLWALCVNKNNNGEMCCDY
jgi:2-polyprenyl-3-methyl-5-hydroxy-6-metoxy-1,4-benzoquinol methylase